MNYSIFYIVKNKRIGESKKECIFENPMGE